MNQVDLHSSSSDLGVGWVFSIYLQPLGKARTEVGGAEKSHPLAELVFSNQNECKFWKHLIGIALCQIPYTSL